MVFGILLMCCNCIVPLLLILFGRMLLKNPPGKNWYFGYRTRRSMESDEAWAFAQREWGRLAFYLGVILLPVSIAASISMFWLQEDGQGILTCVIEGVQIFLLFVSIFPVEAKLKNKFPQ